MRACNFSDDLEMIHSSEGRSIFVVAVARAATDLLTIFFSRPSELADAFELRRSGRHGNQNMTPWLRKIAVRLNVLNYDWYVWGVSRRCQEVRNNRLLLEEYSASRQTLEFIDKYSDDDLFVGVMRNGINAMESFRQHGRGSHGPVGKNRWLKRIPDTLWSQSVKDGPELWGRTRRQIFRSQRRAWTWRSLTSVTHPMRSEIAAEYRPTFCAQAHRRSSCTQPAWPVERDRDWKSHEPTQRRQDALPVSQFSSIEIAALKG